MNLTKIFLWACVIITTLFASLQINDPDPYIWIPIYLIVTFLAVQKIRKNEQQLIYLIPAILYFLWGLSLYPEQWEGVWLNEVGMKTLNIELGRESMGLFINALMLTAMAFIKSK